MDADLKAQADALVTELGMNLTTAFNIFVRQSLREGGIPLSLIHIYYLPGPGIGSDEILAQLHGLLRWVDGALYGRKGQQVSGETQAIL